MAEEQTENNSGVLTKRYGFMTNILRESKNRTKYIQPLEKVTMDAMVSYTRIFISMGIFTFITVLFSWYLFNNSARLPYVIAPVIIMYIGSFILLVNYLISSREKSMLSSTFVLITSNINEKIRKMGGIGSELRSIGIETIDDDNDALIYYSDGRVGRAILVEGELSRSVLPAVADAVAGARKSYLIARSNTLEEKMFTSIREVNVESQLDHLKECYRNINDNEKDPDSLTNLWRKYMIDIIYDDINDKLVTNEYSITQVLFLQEYDVDTLLKSENVLRQHALNGLYSNFKPITKREELVYHLSPIALISSKGARKNAKEQKTKKELQRQ